MRKLLPCLLFLLVPFVVSGCSSKSENSDPVATTATINNNAPEAKTAGAAPTDPSIVYPGAAVKGKKRQ